MTTETQTPTKETKSDLPAIDMSTVTMGAPATPKQNMVEEVKSAQEAPKPSTEKTVFFGGKKFSDVEELAAYTAKLEQEKKALETKPVEKTAAQKKDYFSEFVEDSEGFVSKIKSDIKTDLERKYEAQKNEERIWGKFYEEFPDLKGHEDLVGLTQSKLWSQVENLPVAQGLTEIAKATRQRIAGIKGKTFDGTRELSSGTAVATPVGSTSGSQVAVKVENKDFVTQLRALQKRQRG